MILNAKNIAKSFLNQNGKLSVFSNISIDIKKGDLITIMGPSGSGKSTLLNILGTLESFDKGELTINGKEIIKLSNESLSKIRNEYLGFVFQFHHLIPEFNALENVLIPQQIYEDKINDSYAKELLEFMGLTKRINHYPSELSGGERSRVAIARALVNKPAIIIADEPSGNLDMENADKLIQLFIKINKEFDQSIIIATHDKNVASIGSKSFILNKGSLSESDII
jgi:ABC-type lipoprotein export system ATPase subunit|tara:strand:- start:376 stop:1050 length:675 start_codon:yes stop_codon:yes gene_type:complete